MKNSDIRELFGGFPGAKHIAREEARLVGRVLLAKSPYRYYGIDPQRVCCELEKRVADFAGMKHGLCVSSGTAALHIALYAAGIKSGDEVVIPAYAWGADLMAVLALGAIPVIAPVDQGLGLDAATLSEVISTRTRAVVAVHMRGQPCDIPAILGITKAHGLVLVEDCAQCLGGVAQGAPVGSYGDIAIFSFQFNKMITSGEGGALVTSNEHYHEKSVRFHDLGMMRSVGKADPEGLDAIASLGLNYRMTELQAAMLLAQLDKLPAICNSLHKSCLAIEEKFRDGWERLGLMPRAFPSGTRGNGAFFGLQSCDGKSVEPVVESLKASHFPAQWCGRLDPHHFRVWEAFLRREGIAHRIANGALSEERMSTNLFLEVNSKVYK